MGIFDRFPYSSTHEMNLDFMLGKATEIAEDMQTVATGMAQVQAGLTAISEKTEQATQAAAQAAQSASSIEGSVTAAEEAAEEAQMHNESAQTWANNAMTYKADCQRAATEAAASSSSAAQAATAAAASEDTVAQYAQAANASAQSAANNNDSAHQYANQANASASNATFHSSNAQTAATNANTSATNAETAATNAQTAATRASALKDDCQTLHSMCTTAVDQAATQAVNAANSAAQAAATKTDVENLVESLPEDFTDLNNHVNQLSDEIDNLATATGSQIIAFTENGYIVTNTETINISSPETSDYWNYAVVQCSAGDTFTLNNKGSTDQRGWAFCDSNGNRITYSNASFIGNNTVVIAPANSAYAIFNDLKSNNSPASFWGKTPAAISKIAIVPDTYNLLFNSMPYFTSLNWHSKMNAFSALFNTSTNFDAFFFFTDPHLRPTQIALDSESLDSLELKCNQYLNTLEKMYNSTAADFIVCGGDWLNTHVNAERACGELGYVQGSMMAKFHNYHSVTGNHDTNYLYDDGSTLNYQTIDNLWYWKENTKHSYYSFDGRNSKFYVLDTWTENTAMYATQYFWTQLAWLAGQLATDNPDHAGIFMHIITQSGSNTRAATKVGELLSAFNAHTTATISNPALPNNIISVDYTNCTGHVDFVMGGHTHADAVQTISGIPFIITTTFASNEVTQPTFDMAFADYDNGTLHLLRVGDGSDRTITMAT